MIPEIIINKIYRYIWQMKQRAICIEYKEKMRECYFGINDSGIRIMDKVYNHRHTECEGIFPYILDEKNYNVIKKLHPKRHNILDEKKLHPKRHRLSSNYSRIMAYENRICGIK